MNPPTPDVRLMKRLAGQLLTEAHALDELLRERGSHSMALDRINAVTDALTSEIAALPLPTDQWDELSGEELIVAVALTKLARIGFDPTLSGFWGLIEARDEAGLRSMGRTIANTPVSIHGIAAGAPGGRVPGPRLVAGGGPGESAPDPEGG